MQIIPIFIATGESFAILNKCKCNETMKTIKFHTIFKNQW